MANVKETDPAAPTTKDWFTASYYWFGESDTSWGTTANWYYDNTPSNPALAAPDPTNTEAEITIVDSSSNILKLTGNVTVSTIVVGDTSSSYTPKNQTIDFGTSSVTVSDTTVGITNNGRIALSGTQTLSGTKINGADSVIEYYGNASTNPWGASYNNIEFTDGATGTVGSAITVAGTTLVANGAGNSLSLSGANTFTGDVFIGANTAYSTSSSTISTISDGGTLTLNCASSFNIAADAECASLTVKSDVSCAGKVTTTGSQTYEKTVGVTGDVSGSDITAIGNATFTGKVTSTTGAQRYEGTVSVGGDVDSKTTITALGAATLARRLTA